MSVGGQGQTENELAGGADLLPVNPQVRTWRAMGYLGDRGTPFSASAVQAMVEGDRPPKASE